MASFVLIPGAMHGRWTWDRIVPRLEAAGHSVIAPDLPGMGTNQTISVERVTLANWGDFVAETVRAAPGPVVLVGHSRGGLVIGEAAERAPDRIAGLVYVTALIVPPGQSLAEVTGHRPDPDAPPLAPEALAAIAKAQFYSGCSDADAAWALARLHPEPLGVMHEPATVTWERWGKVPRAFIECSEDATVSLAKQRAMQAAAPCDPVLTLTADHSPFLCAPEALTEALLEAAARFVA
ncbi:alpha/beta fold hydrolase [Novosphingobium sp. PS1R-30]|uniref:Alpha/beta fold hydrolase n=1 Tax=Novosphingobium anseongense TaxID=3133436 RepID=A0ABU8RUH6_9SPHN